MFAAHFAAGLAAKAIAPRAPAWALLTAAILPDLAWIALSVAGVEHEAPAPGFDGWSHSLLSVVVMASLCALWFARTGRRVQVAIGLAVLSHPVLDLIHPRPLALYPHGPDFGPDWWAWGRLPGAAGFSHYWWVQCVATLILLAVYASGARRARIAPNLVAASAVTVLALLLAV
jgi:hypothetical protein